MGAHFEAVIEGVLLMAPLDSRNTHVGFNLISVQVCAEDLANYCQKNPTFLYLLLLFVSHKQCYLRRMNLIGLSKKLEAVMNK